MISDTFLAEFDQEMATTRRVLERVPDDRATWKPHPKSFSMAHLAQLVAWMPGWLVSILRQPRLDLAGYPGYSNETTAWLLAEFDKNVKAARAAFEATTDAQYNEVWSLGRGDMVFMSAPRHEVVRQTINHLIHHRGQLSVYLRLCDVPVPMIYGPSADERVGPMG